MPEFPNLLSAKHISFDLETYDPELLEKGPGGARGSGHSIGYAIAAPGFKRYYPLRHPDSGGDFPSTLRWLKDTLESPVPKIGANILYDMEFAKTDGINVNGPKYDIQIAEFLLDEERKTYKLDALGEAYFGEGKNETGLAEAVRRVLGKKVGYLPSDNEVKSNLYRLPASYVSDYAEQDADLTLRIFEVQEPVLKAEELWDVFQLEAKVLDVLLAMRFKGVPVDVERAIRVREEIQKKAKKAKARLTHIAGKEINPRAPMDLVDVCGRLGLTYPLTEKGSPSFTAPWMQTQSHDLWSAITDLKQLENAANNHVEEKIINLAHNGRLYPSFHPVRKEKEGSDGMAGTRKGRFSSSNPNVQQIPSRHPYLGPLIRSCFTAEAGEQWLSADWSQNEPRLTVHYAALCDLPGAELFRDRYTLDPETDMHTLTAELANIDRKLAKTINLGLSYGMGKSKLAVSLGVPESEAAEIMKRYNDALPFIKLLGDRCSRVAGDRGFIRTIGGRKNRFNVYGPARWTPGVTPLRKAEAIATWGSVRAWGLHKALNALVQGSGGDMVKKAMVDCFADGITPINTVHDEINFSITDLSQAKTVKEIMENVYPVTVPMKVDIEVGSNWGDQKEVCL